MKACQDNSTLSALPLSEAAKGEGARAPSGFEGAVAEAVDAYLSDAAAPSAAQAPSAVFDWDNTCIFNDLSYRCLRQILEEEPSLRLSREQLEGLLPTQVGGARGVVGGCSFQQVRDDILEAYDALQKGRARFQSGEVPLEELPAYRDFRALLLWFYHAAEATPSVGARFAYPWLVQLMAGYSVLELRQLVERTLQTAAREPLGEAVWEAASFGRVARCIGALPRSILPTGLRPFEPIKALMGVMRTVGLTPHIVTASCEQIVQAAVSLWGFDVHSEHIGGQRLAVDDTGVTVPTPVEEICTPIPHAEGKVAIVHEVLGIEPTFVAGDSLGDLDMFHMPEVQLALLIDRDTPEVNAALKARPPSAHLVRQRRDEQRGSLAVS